ncbi:hypothetical protein M422DRAFT_248507 [Sphaerobolus stellatus SS14]|uniref:Uncharacterized protein n=1 Tax=Sphaerobolus stellatus (strain SS14) TaxID=990650 RepID=A0A0C9W4R0_SPHS4|nr:hypothetical protein M422DRAFT_248507 [Sphaerobolus stellatus SS14]
MPHTNNLTHFLCGPLTASSCSVFSVLVTLFEHSPALQDLYVNAMMFVDPFPPHTKDSHELNLNHKRPIMLSLRAVCLLLIFTVSNTLSGVHAKFVDLLIRSCPSIVDLRLLFVRNVDPYPQFLLQGNWPNLARLTLEGQGFYSEGLSKAQKSLIMRNFLSRHSTLRCLSFLGTNLIFKDSIAECSLLNMQSFCLRHHVTTFAATLPVTAAANIRHLWVEVTSTCLLARRLMTRLQSRVLSEPSGSAVSLTTLLDTLSISVEGISMDSKKAGTILSPR